MKRFGFLDRAKQYLEEAGMEVQLFEGIEPDPSVETVMKGAKAMEEFGPDWIVAIGGGSPIDAAKAMWIKYEYPDITFEDMCYQFLWHCLCKFRINDCNIRCDLKVSDRIFDTFLIIGDDGKCSYLCCSSRS